MAQGRRGTSSVKSKRSSHVDMKKSVRRARILVVLPSNPAKALIVITIMSRSPALLEVLTVLFVAHTANVLVAVVVFPILANAPVLAVIRAMFYLSMPL